MRVRPRALPRGSGPRRSGLSAPRGSGPRGWRLLQATSKTEPPDDRPGGQGSLQWDEVGPVPASLGPMACPRKPPPRCASGGTAGSAGRPRIRAAGKGQAWLAAVALGASAPSGGGEPLTCGAVGGGVLRPLSRGPCRVPSRCSQLPQQQWQNRADRCLQHQPPHLSLLLPACWRSGLLCRGWLPHKAPLGSAQPGSGRRHGSGLPPAGGSSPSRGDVPPLRRR